MKIAMVVEWPAVDAAGGSAFSEWETQVLKELMHAADFRPDKIFCAHPHHVYKWAALWEGGKIGGKPLSGVQASREKLCAQLVGYDIVLTLGQHAMWALTGETKIDTYRGTHIDSPFVEGLQVVPTYAPYVFCRMAWNERPVVVSAMRKAKARFEDRPRAIYIPQNVADLYAFSTEHIKEEMAFDVETCAGARITEFSIAPTPDVCLYVQLESRKHESMWSEQDELDIWLWLHFLAQRKDLTWIAHNATYDMSYLAEYGIIPKGPILDTMLRHHAYQPELEKSLGFLASLYIPGRAWKHLRTQSKKANNKAGAVD